MRECEYVSEGMCSYVKCTIMLHVDGAFSESI